MSRQLSKSKLKAQLINDVRKQFSKKIEDLEASAAHALSKYNYKCMECDHLKLDLQQAQSRIKELESEIESINNIRNLLLEFHPEIPDFKIEELIKYLKGKVESQNRLSSIMEFTTGSIGRMGCL